MRNQSKSTLPEVYASSSRGWHIDGGYSPYALEIFKLDQLHYHDTLELGLCVTGEGICRIGDREFPFGPGDVQIIFPFQRHLSMSTGTESSRWCFLNLDPVRILANWNPGTVSNVEEVLFRQMGLYGILHPADYPFLCQLISRIMLVDCGLEAYHGNRADYLSSSLYTLLLELSRVSRDLPPLTLSPVRRFLELQPALNAIEQGLTDGRVPSVSVLSRLCRMSEATFRRAFNDCIGRSPGSYIAFSRIRRAQHALAFSDASILDISLTCGFDDPSGFYRCFCAQCGMSPSAYRKMSRQSSSDFSES